MTTRLVVLQPSGCAIASTLPVAVALRAVGIKTQWALSGQGPEAIAPSPQWSRDELERLAPPEQPSSGALEAEIERAGFVLRAWATSRRGRAVPLVLAATSSIREDGGAMTSISRALLPTRARRLIVSLERGAPLDYALVVRALAHGHASFAVGSAADAATARDREEEDELEAAHYETWEHLPPPRCSAEVFGEVSREIGEKPEERAAIVERAGFDARGWAVEEAAWASRFAEEGARGDATSVEAMSGPRGSRAPA